MTVIRVNCILCSQRGLDFTSYKQHLANFHQITSSQEVLLAVQLMEKKERISLVEKTKTEVINFRDNGKAEQSNDRVKKDIRETTVEELVEAREAPKPRNKHLMVGGKPFRKRKSLIAIKDDAVSSKIKLFSQVRESPLSAPPRPRPPFKTVEAGLQAEKEVEGVSDMLIKTHDHHRKSQISADDTISNFEEIFATNWPSEMDESIEGNFNLIYCEEEAVTQEEGDVHDVKVVDQDGESLEDQNEESCVKSDEKYIDGKGGTEELEDAFINSEESRKLEVSAEVCEKTDDARYKCSSCGKDFKFLTYLKGHQSSKTNCNSKEIKKKRQSMNVSRIGSF